MCKSDLIPKRAVLGCMIFSACFMSYMLRVNMSINLIAMVEPSSSHNGSGNEAECLVINVSKPNKSEIFEKLTTVPDYGVRYDWNSKTQGLILGSFFWGYIASSMPGGLLAEKFGSKNIVGIATLISGVLTILTPLAASWHYSAVIVNRVLLGLLGGVVYPALHCLISKWAPPVEKGKFIGALMGGTLGTVATWPILGAVVENWGWNWAFFLPGGLALIWCFLWFWLVSNTPDEHNTITSEEKFYIIKSHGSSVTVTKGIPPYKEMALSIPFWALAILHFGNCWGLYLLITGGPKFMSEALGFNLGHSGILASLPYLARLLFGFVFGFIGDFIRKREIMTVTTIRKSFIVFSHIIPGLFMIFESFIGCDAILAVAFITISLGMNGASTLTNLQNSQDLAPNFAGTIYGIINCIGGTTGFITPIITGYITEEKSGLFEWHLIFWIGAAVYISCGLVFFVFGTGEEQYWNNVDGAKTKVNGIDNSAFDIDRKEPLSLNTKC